MTRGKRKQRFKTHRCTAGAIDIYYSMITAIASSIKDPRALRRDLTVGAPVARLADTHSILANTLQFQINFACKLVRNAAEALLVTATSYRSF